MDALAAVLRSWPRHQLGVGGHPERQVCGSCARPNHRYVTRNMILSRPVVRSAGPSAERPGQRGSDPRRRILLPYVAQLVWMSRYRSCARDSCAQRSATVAGDDPAPVVAAAARSCGALGPSLRERRGVKRDIAREGGRLLFTNKSPHSQLSTCTCARAHARLGTALSAPPRLRRTNG